MDYLIQASQQSYEGGITIIPILQMIYWSLKCLASGSTKLCTQSF